MPNKFLTCFSVFLKLLNISYTTSTTGDTFAISYNDENRSLTNFKLIETGEYTEFDLVLRERG